MPETAVKSSTKRAEGHHRRRCAVVPSPSPLPLSTSVCGRMLAILFLQALGFAGPFKRGQIEQWTTSWKDRTRIRGEGGKEGDESVGFSWLNARYAATHAQGKLETRSSGTLTVTVDSAGLKVWMIVERVSERETEWEKERARTIVWHFWLGTRSGGGTEAINMLMIMNCNWNCAGYMLPTFQRKSLLALLHFT